MDRYRRAAQHLDKDAVRQWCAGHAVSQVQWASAIDPALWAEATEFADRLRAQAAAKLENATGRFGGGGAVALLYFLVRLRRPEYVVETGVAAGWSTAAILTALEKNGAGHLWSSDFPYFRHGGETSEIGLLVPEALKGRWTLFTEGDEANLAHIVAQVPRIDLLHYDSDKSATGRSRALSAVRGRLDANSWVIFDDIQDNWHFRDNAGARPLLFEEGGKYVGLLARAATLSRGAKQTDLP